ncbi:MAG: redoxin domain-containing protein [Phycisphaerales bacterium]
MFCCGSKLCGGGVIAAVFGAAALFVGTLAPALADGHTKGQPETELKIGEKAPDFTLTDHTGKSHKLSDYKGKIVVLEWFNPECPFVVYAHGDGPLHDMGNKEMKDGVVWFAINSGAEGEQGTGLEKNIRYAKEWEMGYPILFDESGDVGRMYMAKRTPQMYIIDKEGVLRYNGALDNAPMGKKDGEYKDYLVVALQQVKNGETVSESETKPYGCNVKYRKRR